MAAWDLDAHTGRRLAAAALAVALQGVFYWLMLHEAVEPTALRSPKPLQVILFETGRRLHPATLPRKRRRLLPRHAARSDEVTRAVRPITQPPAANSVPHAPHDWQREIQEEARSEESRSRHGKLRFGLPRLPASAPTTPEFGWDYAHTHRLEPLPDGGMLINLTDHCALVLYGLLFLPGCRIGKIPANGDLFDHMYDRRNELPGAPP